MKKIFIIVICLIMITYLIGTTIRLDQGDLQYAVSLISESTPYDFNKVVAEYEVLRLVLDNYDINEKQALIFNTIEIDYSTDYGDPVDQTVYQVRYLIKNYDDESGEYITIAETDKFTIQVDGIYPLDKFDEFKTIQTNIGSVFNHDTVSILSNVVSFLHKILLVLYCIGYIIVDTVLFVVPSIIGIIKAIFYILGL